MPKKEHNIFRYQFLLNFLSKKTSEEVHQIIDNYFKLISNYEDFVT